MLTISESVILYFCQGCDEERLLIYLKSLGAFRAVKFLEQWMNILP